MTYLEVMLTDIPTAILWGALVITLLVINRSVNA